MVKRWLVVAMLFCGGLAFAQTGGSMGGGDWSSSGGGGGDSGGGSYDSGGGGWSTGGGDGFDSGGGGWSTGGGTGGGGDLSPGAILFVIVAVIIFAGFSMWRQRSPDFDFGSFGNYIPVDTVDVSVLRIAIDARARKFVQNELKRIAGIADTKTGEGRATMLREVALLLRKLRDGWVYGGAVNEPMRGLTGAKPVFDKHVDVARSRFREETIRNEQGAITHGVASAYRPRSDEGQGLILVTLVIAARRELFTVQSVSNGDDLRTALESASQLAPTSLVAIEIIWQPSEDEDRLSSMELEAKYPRPELLPIHNALVGKTFCSYCGGPFPAELVSCPHCGAPAPGREKAAA